METLILIDLYPQCRICKKHMGLTGIKQSRTTSVWTYICAKHGTQTIVTVEET
jgi:hypothetical protein